jgi:hypothetical protein
MNFVASAGMLCKDNWMREKRKNKTRAAKDGVSLN